MESPSTRPETTEAGKFPPFILFRWAVTFGPSIEICKLIVRSFEPTPEVPDVGGYQVPDPLKTLNSGFMVIGVVLPSRPHSQVPRQSPSAEVGDVRPAGMLAGGAAAA